jgi:pyruvate dehydrogenase E1 component
MFYKEDTKGQILQEGISEAGAMSSWIAAATSYANSSVPMIPFFIFYSMFGFQRIGDLAWAAGDMRARGFLIGGTSGRTTLNGEGLQHEDGNSHIISGLVPNCVSYDPTFAYELMVILQDGLRRMYQEQEDVYFYITVMNENYTHPGMPAGVEEGIRKGLYQFRASRAGQHNVQLLGSGAILREVIEAAEILERDYSVSATVWSATSFTELQRDGIAAERFNRLNPEADQRIPWVAQCLDGIEGPVIAATDYVRAYAEQIRPYLSQPDYTVLGTDGFGRSDTREKLRRFFEVDRNNVVYAALHALHRQGALSVDDLLKARDKLGLEADKPNPSKV